jgi:hypothetical protein
MTRNELKKNLADAITKAARELSGYPNGNAGEQRKNYETLVDSYKKLFDEELPQVLDRF